ncbi:tail fiber domain-containing protein [Aeromonas jandaei]|nr:tail fiber domain-containing protein [Aeromonas jandaei]
MAIDALKIDKVNQNIDAINGFKHTVNGKEVYHPDNKPSAADLNVVNKAGDTMSGNLTAPKVLVSTAQGTEANSLARKDYVDQKFAGVTSPSAVLPMVIDANKAISIKPAAKDSAGSMSAADKNKLDGLQGFAVDGKSTKLTGPINFDSIESSGFYNLYLAKATGSKNPPPFDYGTMSVIGADKDGNTFVTQVATDQRTGISYTRTRNDGDMAWTGWIENANEFTDFGYQYKTRIEVGGDADKFYPVAIETDRFRTYNTKRYCISRAYNAKAPDTWNNTTHKGGLTLSFEWSGDVGWGGNSKNIVVTDFSSSYTTVCGGMQLSAGDMVVWLRGGGAEYWFYSDNGIKSRISVNLEKFIAPDKKEYLPRTKAEADQAVIDEIMPKFAIRNGGELYDRNRRVLVADGSIPMIGDLKIEKEQAALILKNAAGNAADRPENYGRIRFEHATGDQHIELWHSVHDDYRPGYGLRLLKPADNKGTSNAWLDVQGDVFGQNFIQTTAQSTNAASSTRKDYVDALIATKVNKSDVAASSDYTGLLGKIPIVGGDGVFEIARYIDFHTNGSTRDFDVRLDCYETGKINVVGGILQVGGGDVYHSKNKPTNEDLNLVSRAGDTMTGALTLPKIKGAINLMDKASVKFVDGANTWFHLFSEGNLFKISQGTTGQNNVLSISNDGAVNMIGNLTNTKMITSNTAIGVDSNTRKLALEVGDDKTPYISVDYAYRALQFNENKTVTATHGFEINGKNGNGDYFVNHTGFVGGWARGLRAVNSAGAISAGIGFNGEGDKVDNIYLGVGATPWGDGTLSAMKISADRVNISKPTWVNSGRFQINSASHNILEFHTPGKHARIIWMDGGTGQLNIGTSNGSFTEATRIASIGSSTIELNGAAWSANYRRDYAGQFSTTAPFHVSYGAIPGTSDYYPLVRGRGYATGSGYTTDVDFGVLRSGGTWGQGVIRVGSAESNSAGVQAAFYFDINGNFSAANVRITSDARLKSDFKPIENALYKVEQLTGKTYIKQGKEEREAGIIAQDLQKVLPESVGEFNHADGNKYLSIETAGVNALLIEAIKELSEKVKQLEARGSNSPLI